MFSMPCRSNQEWDPSARQKVEDGRLEVFLTKARLSSCTAQGLRRQGINGKFLPYSSCLLTSQLIRMPSNATPRSFIVVHSRNIRLPFPIEFQSLSPTSRLKVSFSKKIVHKGIDDLNCLKKEKGEGLNFELKYDDRISEATQREGKKMGPTGVSFSLFPAYQYSPPSFAPPSFSLSR